MHDGDIDYSRYTLDELREALAGIDKHRYPKNYERLRLAYARLTSEAPPPTLASRMTVDAIGHDDGSPPRYDDEGRYVPNVVPARERAWNIAFSLALLAYGSYGLWINDLYMPGRRSRGLHLHDVPAWIMYAAFLCACLVMLSVVADHYDRRDNEHHYRAFAEAGKFVGWGLFGASLFWALFGRG